MTRSLVDQHGRVVRDLRLSVTPRCNYACFYCDPLGDGAADPIGTLTVRDVDVILAAAMELGITSVRFTGGEPLLRKELPEMVSLAKHRYGVEDVAMTTNASLLARRLDALLEAGLDRVNISLDAAEADAFRDATGGGTLRQVWEGIDAAERAGMVPIKLNAVVVRDVNDAQLVPLAELARDNPWHVRFIEYMHLNNADPEDYHRRFVSGAESRARIEAALGALTPVSTDPSAPARLYRLEGFAGRIGFVDPVSNPFCGACSRMRVTSDGRLRPCLLHDREFELRAALSADDPVAAVIDAFLVAAHRKVASGVTAPTMRSRTMVGIGG
ncbi:MAG: GTP 3',8-cyclase MoaA [Trueperaceae bacterium]|nr:GTP 3',8-cyclase MoaA [Trueperaceae bacterium]